MNGFVWSRAWAVARKEVFHIVRDPATLGFALAMPLAMLLIYGASIDFNVENIALSVSDQDRSQASRRLVDTITSSHYFKVREAASPEGAARDVTAEMAKATLIIPPRFEKDVLSGRGGEAQVLVDGADNSTVGPVIAYLSAIQDMASRRLAGFDPPRPYQLRTRFLFNPELNSRWFVIPGLTVVVLAILSIMLTALTVSREWENGSMELLLSTPLTPAEIVIGKLGPYAVLGVLAQLMVYVVARALFGVPFAGSLAVFWTGCILCMVTYLAQGIFISVVARKQQVAMQMAALTGMLPTNLLSGFIFPIASMPIGFRALTYLFPARYFIAIARGSYLRGSGFLDLALPFTMLSVFCVVVILAATQRFHRDLEG